MCWRQINLAISRKCLFETLRVAKPDLPIALGCLDSNPAGVHIGFDDVSTTETTQAELDLLRLIAQQ